MASEVDAKVAEEIYLRYYAKYDGDVQGCCPLIADEINAAIGGEPVGGRITWNGGTCGRTHWWIEKNGQVLDPMGDALLSAEEYPGPREVMARGRDALDAILPRYEQYRIALAALGGEGDMPLPEPPT